MFGWQPYEVFFALLAAAVCLGGAVEILENTIKLRQSPERNNQKEE